IEAFLRVDGQERVYEGRGNGPVDALVTILNDNFEVDIRLQDYSEHAVGTGADTKAAAYVELAVGDRVLWGAGLHPNITKATLKAIISAVNRAAR
ncbi:MAG: alpha-isopropylmalate synthase regulatory domain-containing protein, partial [Brevibacterium yomogidense]